MDDQTADYERRIHHLTREVATLHAELQAQMGGAMTLARWLRRRRQEFAPEGSFRHRSVRLVMRGLKLWQREGLRSLASRSLFKVRRKLGLGGTAPNNLVSDHRAAWDYYDSWIRQTEPDAAELERQRLASGSLSNRPLVSLLVPVFNTPANILRAMVDSVCAQTYDNWELCLADGASTELATRAELESCAQRDPRIRIQMLSANRGIAGNSNAALEMARGEFIGLLDHDDVLPPNALFEMVAPLQKNPDLDFLYSDKDSMMSDSGQRVRPLLKPCWSPTIMLSANYLTHLNLIRTELARQVGGFDPRTDGAQDWDFFLRVTEQTDRIARIPRVLYHWRIWPRSTSTGVDAKPYVLEAQKLTLTEHLRRTTGSDWNVSVSVNTGPRVRPPENATLASVSVVIYVLEDSKRCRRLVEQLQRNASIQVILAGDILTAVDVSEGGAPEARDDRTCRIAGRPGESRWSLLNRAAKAATGDAILFLDPEAAPHDEDWLAELSGWMHHPRVAAVCPRVVREDGRLAAQGMIFTAEGRVQPLTAGPNDPCPTVFGDWCWYRDHLAASAACLLVRSSVFEELGGFDESFESQGADFELGLRIHAAGLRVISTPYASVCVPDGDNARPLTVTNRPDARRLAARFHELYPAGDPFFHPALEVDRGGLRFANLTPLENPNSPFVCCDFSAADVARSRQLQESNRGPLDIRSVQWFVPSFHHAFYGGIYTILRLANHLRETRGVESRFAVVDDASPELIRRAIGKAFPQLADSSVNVVVRPGDWKRLDECDAAVATLWTTAFPLLHFNRTRRKFYMIQDYEPLFYPAGAHSALASATYGFGYYGLCNTPTLRHIYEREHGGAAIDFLPCVDTRMFHPSEQVDANRPLTVFFYGRPGNPRNAFELAAEVMRRLKNRLGDRVRIVAAGADWWPDEHGLANVVENLGLLSIEQTAELYRRCDVGMVLMFTRHPSYLPFEFMASGCLTVTNRNPDTAWFLKDGDNCLLSEASVSCLTTALETGLLDVDRRRRITANALRVIRQRHANWDVQMERVAQFMTDVGRAS